MKTIYADCRVCVGGLVDNGGPAGWAKCSACKGSGRVAVAFDNTLDPARPTKDDYAMLIAKVVSSRGTCNRRRVGCVLTTADGHILGTGYNGSAPGAPHCDQVGHLMHDGHCVRTIHAEENAIAHCARRGVALAGCYAYSTTRPCPGCLLLLRAAGCVKVFYAEPYHAAEDDVSNKLIAEMDGIPELICTEAAR